MLKSKEHENWENLLRAYHDAKLLVTEREVDSLVDEALYRIMQTGSRNMGVMWSGGKESALVYYLCDKLGIYDGIQVLPDLSLEFKVIDQWFCSVRPSTVEVKRMNWLNLSWLAERPHFVVVFSSEDDNKYWNAPKWKLQIAYAQEKNKTAMLTGRRTKDGNFCGKGGTYKRSDGITICNPIYDWSTEQLFAALRYKNIEISPHYFWEHGFHITAQTWIDMGLESELETWRYLARYDPETIPEASEYFPAARAFL